MSNDPYNLSDIERRKNPVGWVPPKAPYNPYDPTDTRPPEGYPSEFLTPGKARAWTQMPKDASEFRKVREVMKNLNYTPRPPSELYPGQSKVLKRVNTNARFNYGTKIMGRVVVTGVTIYVVFFHRWNEGFENVFSPFYRFRLNAQLFLGGSLTEQQYRDLTPKERGVIQKVMPQVYEDKGEESKYALKRPDRKHLLQAEAIMQENEERMMRAIDIAEERVKQLDNEQPAQNAAQQSKKWFGLF